MKGLKTVFIFTLAIVLLTELVTSLSPETQHRKDDWWMVNVHVPEIPTESPPTITDCLSRLAVSLAQYTPDFISAFSYIAPKWMNPVNHLLQHPAEGELQKMSTAMMADKKMAKVWNSVLVANAKQFVDAKVVRPVITRFSRAAIFRWLGVVGVGGIGVAIYYLLNNFVSIPIKHQQSSDQTGDQRPAQLTDLSESLRHEWVTQWRSSESVAGTEYSEGEQIIEDDYSE